MLEKDSFVVSCIMRLERITMDVSTSPYFYAGGVSVRGTRDVLWTTSPYVASCTPIYKWTCFYCGSANGGDKCEHCNAPKRERSLASLWHVSPNKVHFTLYKTPWEKFKGRMGDIIDAVNGFLLGY